MSKQNGPENGSQLMPGVKKLCLLMTAAGALCFAFTLLWGFEMRNLSGFAAGTAFACICMVWLAAATERAVRCDVKKAKRIMRSCYGARMAILLLLCAAAMLTGLMSPVGIIVPQLFPRILLSAAHFLGKDLFGEDNKRKDK